MRWLIIIGVSGTTCSGKTTLANRLQEYLSNSTNELCLSDHFRIGQVKIFHQDDYYYPVDYPYHEYSPDIFQINYDVIDAYNMNNLCDDVNKVLGDSFELYSKIQKFNDVVNILVIEGFSIFTWSKIEQLCQLKFHIHLPYEEASARRKVRVYENFPSDVL